MVDVSSQSNKVNITVSSSGVSSNVNASGDTSHYYSEKAREWAISNRIVDGVDYSSKHYAEKSNQSALNAQSFAQSAQDSYNNVQNSAVKALEDIEEDKTNAISEINTTKTSAINNITTAKNSAISDIDTTAKSYNNLTHRQITNCLLEVPQNLKLELNNGTLTLKAGSKVIVPNGFEADGTTPKFNEVVISSDRTITRGWNDTRFLFLQPNGGLHMEQLTNCYSGDTQTSETYQYQVWYDTANNLVKQSSNGGTTWASGYSLPICKITTGDGVVTSIEQVFNGMGYIGSTIFVDKGVKALMPQGRNEDGTARNLEYITSKVTLATWNDGTSYNKLKLFLVGNDSLARVFAQNYYVQTFPPTSPATLTRWFNPVENVTYWWDATNSRWGVGNFACISDYEINNGVIALFQPKLPFRAVDYNDFIDLSDEVDTKVSKNGDTITGRLNVVGNLETTGTGIDLKNKNITKGEKPASASYWGIRFNASNDTTSYQNKRLAVMETSLSTSGMTMFQLGVYQNASGSLETSSLYLKKALDGTSYFSFPRCTTKPTAASSASDEKVSVVTKNYKNGTSGYVVMSDGLKIQWGVATNTVADGNTEVTLLQSYSDTNYLALATMRNSTFNILADAGVGAIPTAVNKFTLRTGVDAANAPVNWVTIGY